MNERNFKNCLVKKSSSPYPDRKKKPRLKFSWSKDQAIDYDNCKQIDIFIQDVIEKAKEDYLQAYTHSNGKYIDKTSLDSQEDKNCNEDIKVTTVNSVNQDTHKSSDRIWEKKHIDSNYGRTSQDGIEMRDLGKDSFQGERKPLINQTREGNCCSDVCLQMLTLLTCYHCRCLNDS